MSKLSGGIRRFKTHGHSVKIYPAVKKGFINEDGDYDIDITSPTGRQFHESVEGFDLKETESLARELIRDNRLRKCML